MTDYKNVVEMHGCIVCGKIFRVLAVYDSENRLFNCSVSAPYGHRVMDEKHALVACDTHSQMDIDAAYKKWQMKNTADIDHEKEE